MRLSRPSSLRASAREKPRSIRFNAATCTRLTCAFIRQHHYHVRLRRVQSERRELAAELICQCLARERDERADRILAAEAADLVDSGRSPVICLGNHCQSKGAFAERRRQAMPAPCACRRAAARPSAVALAAAQRSLAFGSRKATKSIRSRCQLNRGKLGSHC